MPVTIKIFGGLLLATLLLHTALNFMVGNIEDFEAVPLPPKIQQQATSTHPVLKIDAMSKDNWTLVDFSTRKTFQVNDLEKNRNQLSSIPWDLAFQRTKIMSNGGELNPQGQVGVVNLGPVDFDTVQSAPVADYQVVTRSFGKVLNKALSDWYNYRTRTHNVESQRNVYVVRTHDGHFLKMRILNYYCNKNEKDCLTGMCRRDEAACYTVEYVYQPDGSRTFPVPEAATQVVQKRAVDTP
ncbi:MAG: hypothetical protein COV67_02145 [Nitrospinae bacterium CG11_big_fil_rev_8_21_14_0_20_56_8]|nr:MAG: hypothetical protein COV67_02145 [Nitrospinae bacterium CG11_big_fil_rev_8_21_14_0_20_56_8]